MWSRKKNDRLDEGVTVLGTYGTHAPRPRFCVERWTPRLGWFEIGAGFKTAEEAKRHAENRAKTYPGVKYRATIREGLK